MRDLVIVGSGRSGTSMVASLFAAAGYFLGDDLLPAGPGNQRGFFESTAVNSMNEDLLDQVLPARPRDPIRSRTMRSVPRRFQRWAAKPATNDYEFSVSSSQAARLASQCRSPFCLKDPRFCLTLPAWESVLGDAVRVAVFRDPGETVASIKKQGRADPELRDYRMTTDELFRVWEHQYARVLMWADRSPRAWVFVDYHQLIRDGGPVDELESRANVRLDRSLIDPQMQSVSSRSQLVAPTSATEIYMELQRRARA